MNKLPKQLLNKHVTIVTTIGEISGKLLSFQPSKKRNHIPMLLILQTNKGKVIVRAWSHIKTDLRKTYVHVTSVTAPAQKP